MTTEKLSDRVYSAIKAAAQGSVLTDVLDICHDIDRLAVALEQARKERDEARTRLQLEFGKRIIVEQKPVFDALAESERQDLIRERDAAIKERDAAIKERDEWKARAERVDNSWKAQFDMARAEADEVIGQNQALTARLSNTFDERDALARKLEKVRNWAAAPVPRPVPPSVQPARNLAWAEWETRHPGVAFDEGFEAAARYILTIFNDTDKIKKESKVKTGVKKHST